MRQETAKWYVINTYSGYEALVKDSLEKLIENNNLHNTILDIKIPMEETIEEKNGKKKVVQRKVLPCYVFIKMVYSNDMWFLITNSRGVTGFVGPQGKAVPLKADEVRKMRLEERVESFDIAIGETVKIISGAMESYTGEVVELNVEAQKAKVKVEMFGGREMDVEVDFIQLEKLGANL